RVLSRGWYLCLKHFVGHFYLLVRALPLHFWVAHLQHDTPNGTTGRLRLFLALRCAMPVPSVCLDASLRLFADAFQACFSRPLFQHFVTVLVGRLAMAGTAHTGWGIAAGGWWAECGKPQPLPGSGPLVS